MTQHKVYFNSLAGKGVIDKFSKRRSKELIKNFILQLVREQQAHSVWNSEQSRSGKKLCLSLVPGCCWPSFYGQKEGKD